MVNRCPNCGEYRADEIIDACLSTQANAIIVK